jgi:hypothetical protein
MNTIWLTTTQFNALLEYSRSLPTGTTIRKTWKRKDGDHWLMGEYIECPEPGQVGIRWFIIKIAPRRLRPDVAAALERFKERCRS